MQRAVLVMYIMCIYKPHLSLIIFIKQLTKKLNLIYTTIWNELIECFQGKCPYMRPALYKAWCLT